MAHVTPTGDPWCGDPWCGDPWCGVPREEKKRILEERKRIQQDMWEAALIDDMGMYMRDADDEADAEAATAAAASSACGGVVPASKKAIVELYAPTCCGGSRAAEDHGGRCAVCLEGLEMGQEFRMMPCGHTFHQLCIFKWLVINRVCPICQFALPSSEPEEEDDQDMLEQDEDCAAAQERYYIPMFVDFIMSF